MIRPRPELGACLRQDARRLGLTHGKYVVMLAAEHLDMHQFVPVRSIHHPGKDQTSPRIVKGRDSISVRPPVKFGIVIKERATRVGLSYGAYLLSVVEQAISGSRKSERSLDETGQASRSWLTATPPTRCACDAQDMSAADEQQPDTQGTIGTEFGAKEMAAAFVKRPGLYLGFPPNPERATAFIHGFEMALIMAGHTPSYVQTHPESVQPRSRIEYTTPEQAHKQIRALLPAIEELFSAAANIKSERKND